VIKTDDAFQGMVLKGVGPEFDPSFMQEYLVEGEIPAFIILNIIGIYLISQLQLHFGSQRLGDKYLITRSRIGCGQFL